MKVMDKPQQPAVIGVYNLYAGYATKPILWDVTFDLYPNEVVALMGASGCGKTTLIKALAGLIRPSNGRIESKITERNRLSVMFQSPRLQPWLTAKGNVELPCRILGVDSQNVNSLLRAVGIEGNEHKYPFELSGGMQQRVALARALITDPVLLLLDEPFLGVDELTKERLFDLLSTIIDERGITCLFTTHNPYEAVFLANRIIVLGGNQASVSCVHEVNLKHPRTDWTRMDSDFSMEVFRVRESLIKGR